MARASEEFLLAWQSLPPSGAESGWRTIPVTAPSAGCAIRAGRKHPAGQEAVLAGFDQALLPASEKLPDGQGFFVERVPMDDGWTWLAMTRSESGQFDLFVAMVCDVVGLLDAANQTDRQTQMRLFIERVRAWQEFMRKGVTALGPEREVGLIGELTVLNGLLDEGLGYSTAIDAWKGPLDGEQDFELGMGAVEVKATVSQTGFPARVGSLQQLDDHIRQPLFLAGVKLRLNSEGFNLPSLVAQTRERLREAPVAAAKFDRLLLDAGHYDGHASQYSRRFELAELRVREVTGNFPRLTVGNVPAGVTAASYSIDLDRNNDTRLSLEQALMKLGMKSK
ncbi:PD-(D/E)XK motif protein [Hydrogenophaga taeniospiralis]|uniref:PD-(D/E)XK motif protein n=1 Tax=Hydrogenophaga taeniospiralis TaxID=65656 RepID=UPI0008365B1B|nr:PD-(D/E)XK motif protein [Hydrogenophaga taeniospiralis]